MTIKRSYRIKVDALNGKTFYAEEYRKDIKDNKKGISKAQAKKYAYDFIKRVEPQKSKNIKLTNISYENIFDSTVINYYTFEFNGTTGNKTNESEYISIKVDALKNTVSSINIIWK